MGISSKWAIVGLAATIVTASASAGMAQDVVLYEGPPEFIFPVADQFSDAFFTHEPEYYNRRSIPKQARFLFGPYSELAIERDAKNVNTIYNAALARQAFDSPILRTPDLPNPFSTSVLTIPVAEPLRPTAAPPPVIETPPQLTPQTTPRVPALW